LCRLSFAVGVVDFEPGLFVSCGEARVPVQGFLGEVIQNVWKVGIIPCSPEVWVVDDGWVEEVAVCGLGAEPDIIRVEGGVFTHHMADEIKHGVDVEFPYVFGGFSAAHFFTKAVHEIIADLGKGRLDCHWTSLGLFEDLGSAQEWWHSLAWKRVAVPPHAVGQTSRVG